MNRLNEVLDRPEPTMAVPITQSLEEPTLRAVMEVADVLEFRADLFPAEELPYIDEEVSRLGRLPILLTVRCQLEGGGWTGSEDQRLATYQWLLPMVDGVDIEVAANIAPPLVEAAHDQDKVVIASSHDFTATPEREGLENILANSQQLGADFTKIAVSAKTEAEYLRLVEFTLGHKDENVIVVAMDDFGSLSRVVLPSLGSHLTYARVTREQATAVGQLGYAQTHRLLSKLYPDYSKLFDDTCEPDLYRQRVQEAKEHLLQERGPGSVVSIKAITRIVFQGIYDKAPPRKFSALLKIVNTDPELEYLGEGQYKIL